MGDSFTYHPYWPSFDLENSGIDEVHHSRGVVHVKTALDAVDVFMKVHIEPCNRKKKSTIPTVVIFDAQ